MKIKLILILTIYIGICPILSSANPVNEIIRSKIEAASIIPLKANGERIICTKTLPKFYQQRIFETAWNSPLQIEQLVNSISKADEEGLNPKDYHLQNIKILIDKKSEDPNVLADLDLLLTDAFLLYTTHLLSGKVNPESADPQWQVIRNEGDPLQVLQDAVSKGDISAAIANTVPKHKIYQGLKSALQRYDQILKQGGWKAIDKGPTLKRDMEDVRVPDLRSRLIAGGDLEETASITSPLLYDENIEKAVIQFQKRHGLEIDGNVGPATLNALNIPAEKRAEQIKVNLERWRWLPQDIGNHYIKVNIANFELEIIKNNKPEIQMAVVVGKEYRQTPVFNSNMTYLVLNPTWTVPPGILRADILPAVRKNSNYLKNKNIKVIGADGKEIDQATIDWSSASAKGYTYRQDPGKDNSLGAVKFMFPNKYSVYIHDTPAKELFEKAERAFSSGCIRASKPVELAEYLLNDSIKWSKELIISAINLKKTQTLNLPQPIAVYILYWTAWSDDTGLVHFRKDIYTRDAKIADALNAEAPPYSK